MKFLLTMIFSTTILFSQISSSNITLDNALKLYKEQKYDKAFDAFLILLENDLSSIDLNLYFAQCATRLKKYSEAIATYERILINHPNHQLSKLELARIYFLRGQFKLSTRYFNEVLQTNPPLQVKINIANYLKKIKAEDTISSLSGVLQIGANYDSNINGASNADTFYVPALGATFTNTSLNAQDWSHQEIMIFNHKLNTKKHFGFSVKNDFIIYNRELETYSDYNIIYLNHAHALSWDFDKLSLDVGLSLDSMWYGGEHFLENHALFSKLTYKASPQSNYMLMLKDITKNYQQTTYFSRNAKQQELTLSYQTRLNQRWALFLKEIIQIERKTGGTNSTVDYDSYDSSFGLTYLWTQKIRLNMMLAYKDLNYLEQDPFFKTNHQENRSTLKVGLQTAFTSTLTLDATLVGLKNASSIETTNYERFGFSMNLSKKF